MHQNFYSIHFFFFFLFFLNEYFHLAVVKMATNYVKMDGVGGLDAGFQQVSLFQNF